MTEPSQAVFLSYASEDAEAAERIAAALRAAGIEAWLDKSELRGGDAWDRQIQEQIRDCRLFIPVISAHSEQRDEGYFRREWALAVDRTRDMAEKKAFLLPVVIDDTSERRASVPEKFRQVQWSRLPAGETSSAFVGRVQRLLSPEASTPIRASGPTGEQNPPPTKSKRILPVAVAGMIGVALLIGFGYLGFERLRGSRPVVQGESIAVLPLANESDEASQQYFSDGISEDLITALSQFPGLKVIGRTSAFQFRDSKDDSHTIGTKLGVAHLLEGSVRRAGDTVRVTTDLIDTADGSTQWSERYDRPYKDLFALQDEITRAVAGALKAKLLPGAHAAAQSDRPPSGNLEAYNALLQGRFYLLRSNTEMRKAIDSYTQAIALDPGYALAWSGLSETWTRFAGFSLEGAAAQEAYAKAREAANRALALSPELAAAHVARGYLLYAEFDWRGAETEYHRALTLAPNDADAKIYFGKLLATFGEPEQALELTREALATDPLRASWYSDLADYLATLNRLDEAERAIAKAIELQPAAFTHYGMLTIIEVLRGNAQAAVAAAQKEPIQAAQDIALGWARQIGGDQRAADAALRTLIERYPNAAAYQIAEVYALRNDANGTFEWLDRAWGNRDPGVGRLLYDPFIRRYRNDPRFAAFCRKVGLPVPGEASSRKST